LAFELQSPGGVYSFSPRHDTYLGNFQWGILTAFSPRLHRPLFPPLMLWAQSQPTIVGIRVMMSAWHGLALCFPQRLPAVGPKFPRRAMGRPVQAHDGVHAPGRSGLLAAVDSFTMRRSIGPCPVAAVAAGYLMFRTIQNRAHARGLTIAHLGRLLLGARSTSRHVRLPDQVAALFRPKAIENAAKKERLSGQVHAQLVPHLPAIEATYIRQEAGRHRTPWRGLLQGA